MNISIFKAAIARSFLALCFSFGIQAAHAWSWPTGTVCVGGSKSGASSGQLCCATSNGDVCQTAIAKLPFSALVAVVDVNTASQQTLAAIPGIGPQTAQAIVTERGKRPFQGALDMASRLCQSNSVDFGGETSVKIQGEMHSPRGVAPKDAGFKCAAGAKEVDLAGKKHNYVGHVTLLK